MTTDTLIAFSLQESGLYPYPEFVSLFKDVFVGKPTKAQVDEVEKLIAGGLNRKRLAKLYDDLHERDSR